MRLVRPSATFALPVLVCVLARLILPTWSSPLPHASPAAISIVDHIESWDAEALAFDRRWLEDGGLVTRVEPLIMNAGSGWTMTFAPHGQFLPLQSVILILEDFYRLAIVHAVKAQTANLPAQQIVNIFLGSLGKSSDSSQHTLYSPALSHRVSSARRDFSAI